MMEIVLFQIKKASKYKMQLFMDIVSVILNFFMHFFLWKTVLINNNVYFNHLNDMVIYYFVIAVLSILLKCNASDIAEAFKHGKMDREIIRPIHLFEIKMLENIYTNIFLFFCTFPILLIMVIVGCKGDFRSLSLVSVFMFLVSACFGYFIFYCIDFLIGLMALLIDEVWAIRGVVSFCINMVAGYYLPIEMFPEKVINFLEFTPFYYIYYWPVKLITGSSSIISLHNKFFTMLVWAIILFIISKIVFKRLIKRYTAFGG